MSLALCSLIFAYCEKITVTGAHQVGHIAGPLPDRQWGSWTACNVIQNSRKVTRAERILVLVHVIFPHVGNGAWSGLPGLKLQYQHDTVSVSMSTRAVQCGGDPYSFLYTAGCRPRLRVRPLQ